MKILLLGSGKTGSLVNEVARERGHEVETLRSADNANGSGLTQQRLSDAEVVVDFTAPHCVLANLEACVTAGKNMVVGTTGWYSEIPRMKTLVSQYETGFLFGPNFSMGVNLFLELVRAAAPALAHGYSAQIYERHHEHKQDAPSGTAMAMQKTLQDASKQEIEITSFREGEVIGLHELVLGSVNDCIYLCHDAKTRRGFAEGAVRGAEWLRGQSGFFEFKDVWKLI